MIKKPEERDVIQRKAHNQAMTRLKQAYPTEFAEFYQEEKDKLGVGDERRPFGHTMPTQSAIQKAIAEHERQYHGRKRGK